MACAPAFFLPAWRFPTWFRWRESGRAAESVSGGDGLLANPRSRPTPLSDVRTPASESVGWLLLLFAIEKQGKRKVFPAFFRKTQKSFGNVRFLQPLFFFVLLGPKVPKASASRSPREDAPRGAARGAQDRSLCATPRLSRRMPHPLFPRRTRVRNYCAAEGGIIIYLYGMRSGILFTRMAIPDLVPMARKRTGG